MQFSAELIRQTELALEYLDRVKTFITYMKLVPVEAESISAYEKAYEKVVPPDYRYWLEKYGSGRIEFKEGVLEIPSIFELMADGGRTVDNDDPANCWQRIYIGGGCVPITIALDSTIIDDFGCAPVIKTELYGNHVDEVLSSSWPTYFILKILEIVKGFTTEQLGDPAGLMDKAFDATDVHLRSASIRAEDHNKTKLIDGESFSNLEMICSLNGVLDALVEGASENRKSLLGKIYGLLNPDDKFIESVDVLDSHISQGYSYLGGSSSSYAACSYLEEEVAPRHEQALRQLMMHDRREMRDIAKKGLQKLAGHHSSVQF